MRKLVGIHEDLLAERSNSMKSLALMQDKINALKSEMDWIYERNSSLLKTNLELKSMLRKSEKLKDKNRKRTIEGELIYPFPTTGERLQRRMSNESNDSSTIAETVEPSYYLSKSRRASVQPPTVVPSDTRRATMQSTDVYVPFPKERQRSTVSCNPFNSKRYGLLDTVLAFFHFPSKIDHEPNTSPGLFRFSSRRQLVEEHES